MLATRGALSSAMGHLCRVADHRSPISALSHVTLTSKDGFLRVTATDGSSWLSASVPASGEIDVILPAKALADFIKAENKLDRDGLVELNPIENHQVVVAVDGAMATLSSLVASEFPSSPGGGIKTSAWVGEATWDVSEFAEKLGWVLLAAGRDETRRHLTGILFDNDRVVAVDGHRLHLCDLKALKTGPALVSARAISTLLRVLPKSGDVCAHRAKDVVRFETDGWLLEAAAMPETFPPFEQVIPKSGSEDFIAVLDRRHLGGALSKITKRSSKPSGVRTKWNGALSIERDDPSGCSTSNVPFIESSHAGEEVVIGVDGRYLVDAVSAGAARVTAHVSKPLDPIRLDVGDDRIAVVMPMRL